MLSSAKDRIIYPLVPYRRKGGEAVKSPRAMRRYTWHAPLYLLLVADVATVTYRCIAQARSFYHVLYSERYGN